MKAQLPKGKLTIRHSVKRNFFQCYAGRIYIEGASGENAEQAAQELSYGYIIPFSTTAKIYGHASIEEIKIPETNNE